VSGQLKAAITFLLDELGRVDAVETSARPQLPQRLWQLQPRDSSYSSRKVYLSLSPASCQPRARLRDRMSRSRAHRESLNRAWSPPGSIMMSPRAVAVEVRKIASVSAVAFRKLTEDQMVEILSKAPQNCAAMR
jgi:hypothetical protein